MSVPALSIVQHYANQNLYAVLGGTALAGALRAQAWAAWGRVTLTWSGNTKEPTFLGKDDRLVVYAPLSQEGPELRVAYYRSEDEFTATVGGRPRFQHLDAALLGVLYQKRIHAFDKRCADAVVVEVNRLIASKELDPRSMLADAVLDYTHGEPTRVPDAYAGQIAALQRTINAQHKYADDLLMKIRRVEEHLVQAEREGASAASAATIVQHVRDALHPNRLSTPEKEPGT